MSYAEDVSETGISDTRNITVRINVSTNGVAVDA